MSEDALKIAEMASEIWRLKYLKERDTFREHQEAWKKNNHHHAAEIEQLKKEIEAMRVLLGESILAEREACAKVADEWQTEIDDPRYQCDCAEAIRARGEKP
jgi:hypothetical protein